MDVLVEPKTVMGLPDPPDPALCRPLGTDARGTAQAIADTTDEWYAGSRLCVSVRNQWSEVYAWYRSFLELRNEAAHATLWRLYEGTSAEPEPLAALEVAAQLQDEESFRDAATRIDWNDAPAEDIRRAVRLALQAGAHLTARRLAQIGGRLHPQDPELQKMTRVLAPPVVSQSEGLSSEALRRNQEWLHGHRHEHSGRWVALRDGELLGTADSPRDLIERFGVSPQTMVTRA